MKPMSTFIKGYYLLCVFFMFPFISILGQLGSGASDSRSVNINDVIGSKYQDNKRAVCIIRRSKQDYLTKETLDDSFTATLVNTVNQNGKLYLLTAEHTVEKKKGDSITGLLSFNYEALNPDNRLAENDIEVRQKVNLLVKEIYPELDMALLEIQYIEDKESLSNLYYAGWSLENKKAGGVIGHPQSDLKKINLKQGDIKLSKIKTGLMAGNLSNGSGFEFTTLKIYSGTNSFQNGAKLERGSSGSGLLTEKGQVIGVVNSISDRNNYFLAPKLSNAWMDENETPLFQQYLDPNITYVSSIPGGYGLEKEKYSINDSHFDLEIPGGAIFMTPNIDQGVDKMVKMRYIDIRRAMKRVAKNPQIQQGGIYRKKSNFRLTIIRYVKDNPERPAILYSCEANGTGSISPSGNFEENRPRKIQIYAGGRSKQETDTLNISVVIKLENLSNETGYVRALKIPGLGYRNAVELFKPGYFESLYTNSNYPENRAVSSTSSYLDSISISTNRATKGYKTNNNGGYVNLIQHKIATVKPNEEVSLTFFPKVTGQSTMHYSVWIDYNEDHKFDDPGENVIKDVTGSYNEPVTASFTIPENLHPLKTRIRIAMRKNSSPLTDGVGVYEYGEVEDYTIGITNEQEAKELFTEVSEELKGENIIVKDGNTCISYKKGSDKAEVGWKMFKDSQGVTNTSLCDCVTVKKNEENNTYHLFFSGDKSYLDVDQDKLAIVRQIQGTDVSSHRLKITTDPKPLHLYRLKTNKEEDTKLYALESADNLSVSFPYQLIPVQNFNNSTTLKTNKDVVSSADHKSIIIGTVLGVGGGSAGAGYLIKNRSKFLKGNKYQRLENKDNETIELKMCKQD